MYSKANGSKCEGRPNFGGGKLTDDDLDKVAGQFDVFAGLLQEKYGYSREQAEEEIEKQMNEYEARLKNSMPDA